MPLHSAGMDEDYVGIVAYSETLNIGGGTPRLEAALFVKDTEGIERAVATIALGGQVVAPAALARAICNMAAHKGIQTISSHHDRHPALGQCSACDESAAADSRR
jgi:hypothetical protein